MKKYLIALVMIVMIMSCFFGKTLVMANEESDDTVYNRYYTTIEVVRGTFRAKTKMVFSKFFIVFQNVITITFPARISSETIPFINFSS